MTNASAAAGRSSPYRFVVLSVSLLVVFASIGLARFGYTMLLPFMESSLPLTKSEGGLLASANLSGYLVLSLLSGFLSVRFGARRVILCALALTAAALAATAFARDLAGAFVARFLTGLASGGANVPAMALLSAWFGARERGLASGLAVGGTSLGLAVSGLCLPLFVSRAHLEGLPGAWLFLGGCAGAVFLIALAFLRNGPRTGGAAPDGAVRGGRGLIAAVPGILRRRGFPALAVAYFLYGFSYIIYATFFVNFLIKERRFAEPQAAGLWFLAGVAGLASGVVWGKLSDHMPRPRALALVYALLAASFAAFGLAVAPAFLYASAFVFALCAWSVPAVMAAAAGDMLGREQAPVGFGILTCAFGLGQALGPTVAGAVAGASASYAPAFILAAVASAAGAGVLSFVRLHRPQAS